MSQLTKHLNRFKPKSEVEWLSLQERKEHRTTLSTLSRIVTQIERGQTLSELDEGFAQYLVKSQSVDTRLNAVVQFLEQTELSYQKKLCAMAPHSLSAFHEAMNMHEPPAHHHEYLCDRLEKVAAGDLQTLIIALPPGAAKSTYTSRSFVQWTMGKQPDWRILAVGSTQKFTEDEFSKPNRAAIDSEIYNAIFPDVYLNPSEKGASFWRLQDWRGLYACRGAMAHTAGLRARLIVADDLYKNAQDALSPVVRNGIWRWWTADVMSRRLPNCPVVLVNTLWHSDDVPNSIKRQHEEMPGSVAEPFEFINIPAEAAENDPLGRKPGEWLWCVDQQEDGFYTIKDYETKRDTMPPSLWSALYLGKTMDQQGEFVAEEKFHRYDSPPMNIEGHTREWVKTVISIDCAQKGKERSDYTVMLVFRQHIDGRHFLVGVWRSKDPLEKIVAILGKLIRIWEATSVIIEDTGMGVQILDNYKGKFTCPLIAYTPAGKGSKEFRFDAAVPFITSGKFVFPKHAPWLAEFINELVAFPNATYDDQVDAFSQYASEVLKIKVGGTKKMRPRL
jgi:predicted phage terminase large subunit-like protein